MAEITTGAMDFLREFEGDIGVVGDELVITFRFSGEGIADTAFNMAMKGSNDDEDYERSRIQPEDERD